MLSIHTISRGGLTLLFAIVTLTTFAQAGEIDDAVAAVGAVPRQSQWSLIEPQLRPVLREVTQMSPAERDRLIRSDDARLRGIGIFVAEQQGDLALLLSLSHLLDDHAQTVSYARPVAHADEYVYAPQTVAAYLSSVYSEWFGVDVDKSRKRFAKLFDGVTDPERLIRPWIVRLRRARGDAERTAELKTRIGDLPEDVRWAVLTLGHSNSLYTAPEARTALAQLSPATQTAILDRADLLPNEPLFRMNGGTYRKLALRECQRLLRA